MTKINDKTSHTTYDDIHAKQEFYIFDDRKLVYLSLAKIASSSIKAAIAQDYSLDWKHWKELHRFELWEKDGPKMKWGRLTEEENTYYKFVFVRNPFERLVSCYHNKILDENYFEERYPYYNRYQLKHKISFSDFVNILIKIPIELADEHLKPQSAYINEPGMPLLFDFVGRFENLSEDWKYIANRFKFTSQLKHINSTHNKKDIITKQDYRAYYTKDLLEKVYNYYREDVHLLGYINDYKNLCEFIS